MTRSVEEFIQLNGNNKCANRVGASRPQPDDESFHSFDASQAVILFRHETQEGNPSAIPTYRRSKLPL